MCDKATIERVRADLRKTLLPMDSLREKVFQSVDIAELLTPKDDIEFIRLAYRRILNRSASENCIQQWIVPLEKGSLTRVDVLMKLKQSKEGRRRNIQVLGLEMYAKDELKENPRKRRWWKRLISKLKLSRMSAEDVNNMTNLDRRVASLAADWLEVTENIEHQLRQLRSSANCGTLPSLPNLYIDEQSIAANDIAMHVQQMHAAMAQVQDATPPSSLEGILSEIGHYTDKSDVGQGVLRDWLIATDGVQDVIRGCRSAGIEIANWAVPASSLGYIRSLGIPATLETTLTDFLASQPLESFGGILLESRLSHLDDNELIKCLLLASGALVPGGCLLIVETTSNQPFHVIRLQSALQACGFTNQGSTAQLQSKYADTMILLAKAPVRSEVSCDS
ncbi:hypothetical protein Pan97_06780 [Bremerella volcania]|uniref:DUF4214 domain-containing protein n=1 Tax=Bremerella volcania TaxID=2527984 RepID=A0A518C383_9BACT|nr:DUF4214 domain-containing protein [Bremerella volcania]QDU73680.1 hypothetical protein Pan97_06780 [Bremerella volcania]